MRGAAIPSNLLSPPRGIPLPHYLGPHPHAQLPPPLLGRARVFRSSASASPSGIVRHADPLFLLTESRTLVLFRLRDLAEVMCLGWPLRPHLPLRPRQLQTHPRLPGNHPDHARRSLHPWASKRLYDSADKTTSTRTSPSPPTPTSAYACADRPLLLLRLAGYSAARSLVMNARSPASMAKSSIALTTTKSPSSSTAS